MKDMNDKDALNYIFRRLQYDEKDTLNCIFHNLSHNHPLYCDNFITVIPFDLNGTDYICHTCKAKKINYENVEVMN